MLTEKQETSLLYRAYEDGQPRRAILAALSAMYTEVGTLASITQWDGNSNQKQGLTLSVSMAFKGDSHGLEIRLFSPTELGDAMSVADVVSVIVRTLQPAVVEVAPRSYVLKKAFPERVSAG